jgi:hypothetical protein
MKRNFILGMAVFLIALLTAGISLISCGGGGGSSGVTTSSTGTGSVSVLLADSPTDEYQNIWIRIHEVSLIPVNDGAPVVIFQSTDGLRVDLLEYQDEDYLLRVKRDVPAGQYSKIRLQVSDIEPTPKDPTNPPPCAKLDIDTKLPSGKIDLNPREPFTVSQGGNLSIRLDIDANKSINLHPAGKSGKCIFRPVVFVDIREGMPIGRCPKIVSGEIASLSKDSGGNVVGFTLDLKNNQGAVEVRLLANVTIVNENGECQTANDLNVGDEVRVRGKLANDLVFEASNVVIGELLNVVGTATTDPVFNGSTFTFTFTPSAGQALVGPYTVQGQVCTLVLFGCDTTVKPEDIKAGMTVRVFGKLISENNTTMLRAAAIVLKVQEIAGTITAISPRTGGQDVTIQQIGGTLLTVFVPDGTLIYLEGDGAIPVSLLCVGRYVRVFLNPDIPNPLTASQVKVMSVKHEGTVKTSDTGTRTLTVDVEGSIETVVVSNGATILKSTSGVQSLTSFEDIKVDDYIVYFGLTGCGTDTKFYAFVIVVSK